MPSIKSKKLQPVNLSELTNSSNSIDDLGEHELSLVKGGEININSVLFNGNGSEIIGTDVNIESYWASARDSIIIAYG